MHFCVIIYDTKLINLAAKLFTTFSCNETRNHTSDRVKANSKYNKENDRVFG